LSQSVFPSVFYNAVYNPPEKIVNSSRVIRASKSLPKLQIRHIRYETEISKIIVRTLLPTFIPHFVAA